VNKENLWQIGVLVIVVGAFFISLFLLSSEEIHFMSDLIPYTAGFLITGLIASFFGFLFTIVCLDRYDKAGIKPDNTTKIRVLLIVVSILYLTLIGYLLSIGSTEWTVEPLIIDLIDPAYPSHLSYGSYPSYPLYAFYDGFTLSSHDIFVVTLFMYGFLVLPFVITETGLLDDSIDEQNHDLEQDGFNIDEAEALVERFFTFIKMRTVAIKKITIIKNYTLPIAITFSILGSCLVGLPYFLFRDGLWTWDSKEEIYYIENYKGVIRGQLLLIGLLFLAISLILIIQSKRHHPNSEKKTETS